MKPVIRKVNVAEGRRMIAVSDIHGNLPYFKALLDKIGFCKDDVLFIVGDMVEKGEHSLATLRYIMQLCKEYEVYPIQGNCDVFAWPVEENSPWILKHLVEYFVWRENGLFNQMCDEIGYTLTPDTGDDELRRLLRENFPEEHAFLDSLPTMVETQDFCFVHGGRKLEDPDNTEAYDWMKFDDFRHNGQIQPKYCIVGHWPVVLYGSDKVCASPLVDRERRVVSIDGGCVLKDDGQLNALIMHSGCADEFEWDWYDPFPVMTAVDAQKESESSYYIRWGDNEVFPLTDNGEFTRRRHARTGYEMDILTKYLSEEDGRIITNDCSDYYLPISPGDRLAVVETTERGYYVKKNGTSGWYCGRLV